MSFLFRSVAAARSAASASFAPRASATPFAALRFSSSSASTSTATTIDAEVAQTSTDPSSSSTTRAALDLSGSTAAQPRLDLSAISYLPPKDVSTLDDVDSWWRKSETLDRNPGVPGNQFIGRSLPVRGNYAQQYSRLSSLIRHTGMKAEVRRAMYHEKPSDRKTRLRSERWRRQFAEKVSR
jgi:hypothetical protein